MTEEKGTEQTKEEVAAPAADAETPPPAAAADTEEIASDSADTGLGIGSMFSWLFGMSEEKDVEKKEEEVAASSATGDEAADAEAPAGDETADAETPTKDETADAETPTADADTEEVADDSTATGHSPMLKWLCGCCVIFIFLLFIIYGVAWIFSDECTAEKPVKSFQWLPPKYECFQCLEGADCANPDV